MSITTGCLPGRDRGLLRALAGSRVGIVRPSALRDDFGPESDIDVLVSFEPGARHTLFDIVRMQDELSRVFGRQVDLATRAAVEGSRNYIRRKAILESAQVVYAA